MENARTASTQYHEQMMANHGATKAIVEDPNFNEAAARQLIAKKTQLMTELNLIRLRTDNAIYNLLTADQKARFEQVKRERPKPPTEFRQ